MKKIVEKYLYDEYADEIRMEFSTHGRLMIKSPTGTGKTYLIKELAVEYNAVILVPTLDMLELYACDDITKVTSDELYNYNPFKPCVMIWDTARILHDRKTDICGRVWFVDEPHSWFDDRRYRVSAVDTMIMARSVEKLLCVSATPSGEVEELGLHLLEYCVNRRHIPTDIALTAKPEAYISTMIRQAKKMGRKCAVLTDEYAVSIWASQRYSECDKHTQLLHSRERGTIAYEKVLHHNGTESLFCEKTTICTRIAEMGFNFMNAEPMFVIVHLNLGEHTANKVIQFTGRLRCCNNMRLLVVVDTRRKARDIVQDARDTYGICDLTEGRPVMKAEVSSRSGREYGSINPDQIIALKSIQDYVDMHSTIPMIEHDLRTEGYFDVGRVVAVEDDKLMQIRDERMAKSEAAFRDMLFSWDIDESKLDEYQKKWYEEMKVLSSDGFDLREFMISGFTKSKRIDNIIADAHTIIRVGEFFGDCCGFESEFDYKRLNGIDPKVSMNCYRMLQQTFNRCWKYYSVMKRCNSVDEYFTACINGAVAKNKLSAERKSEGGKRGGSKGGKRNAAKEIRIRNRHNGNVMTFDSREKAAEWMGCSRVTFSHFLSKGNTKFNKDYEIVQ